MADMLSSSGSDRLSSVLFGPLTDLHPTANKPAVGLALAREFRTLASLRHLNIVSVFDYGFESAERPFFTMELLPDAEPILRVLPRPFLMIDNTRAQPARPEVRRQLVEWARAHRVGGGVVIFGADLPTRTIGMLLLVVLALAACIDRVLHELTYSEAGLVVIERPHEELEHITARDPEASVHQEIFDHFAEALDVVGADFAAG